jgi:hypothetical protein
MSWPWIRDTYCVPIHDAFYAVQALWAAPNTEGSRLGFETLATAGEAWHWQSQWRTAS